MLLAVLLCLTSWGYIIMLLVCFFRWVAPTRNAGRRWGFRFYWNMWIPTFRWHLLPLSSWSGLAVDLSGRPESFVMPLWEPETSHCEYLFSHIGQRCVPRGPVRVTCEACCVFIRLASCLGTSVLITWFSGSRWHLSFALGTEASLGRSLIVQ